jgi:glutamine amidotransferase
VSEVVIIDNGGANIASVRLAFQRLGASAILSSDAERVSAATHVILPGVGAACDAMDRLTKAGLDQLIPTLKQPLLGICLGMQLLYGASEEGATPCLGVFGGVAKRLNTDGKLAVPHMGWNEIEPVGQSLLLRGIRRGEYAYFAHSYALPVGPDTVARCTYGMPFTAVVSRDNFYGAQFHPERSGPTGQRFLANFLALKA